ncbi:MAG: alpha/beta hydrolase [Planctomycetaceae bacterium]|nr:alpha/beta hydrolase [Planctomycetaceae bacterium]
MKMSLAALWLLLAALTIAPTVAVAQTAAPEKKPAAKQPAPKPETRKQPTPEEAAKQREVFLARIKEKVDIRPDVPYADNDNPRQQVDIYLPKDAGAGEPLPVVLFIHGGGWSGGDRKSYLAPASQLAFGGKYAAISVGYRMSSEAKWPAQIHDCKAAVRWVRAHAKELNIDPTKIGATGGSAGGHLVTMLGLTAGNKELEGSLGKHTDQSSAVTCVINFCGPSDMAAPLMQGEAAKVDDPAVAGLVGGSLKEKADAVKQASPLTWVSKNAAPIMTVHGMKDARVNFNNATKLDEAMKQAGAVHYLVPVTEAGHGIPIGPDLAGRMQKFWDKYLRGQDAEIVVTEIQ